MFYIFKIIIALSILFNIFYEFKFEVQYGRKKVAKNTKLKMHYKHISKKERGIIEKLTQVGSSNRYPRVKPVVL